MNKMIVWVIACCISVCVFELTGCSNPDEGFAKVSLICINAPATSNSSRSVSIARNILDPNGSGARIYNEDLDTAYTVFKNKHTLIGFITPTKFSIPTCPTLWKNPGAWFLFGTLPAADGNGVTTQGVFIDFMRSDTLTSSSNMYATADTYPLFYFQIRSPDDTVGITWVGNAEETSVRKLLQIVDPDDFSLESPFVSFGTTSPTMYGGSQPLLLGESPNLPMFVDTSKDYLLTLAWFLGTGNVAKEDTQAGDGIIAHYQVNAAGYSADPSLGPIGTDVYVLRYDQAGETVNGSVSTVKDTFITRLSISSSIK